MQRIYQFLKQIEAHNDREWFHAHQPEYKEARGLFEEVTRQLILRIAAFDSCVAYQTPKTCIYRFARDTRFSEDKSPYKRHFGAFVCSHGRKSYRGGLLPACPAGQHAYCRRFVVPTCAAAQTYPRAYRL